jgi:hypothetical protein
VSTDALFTISCHCGARMVTNAKEDALQFLNKHSKSCAVNRDR